MTLGCEVDNACDLLFLHECVHGVKIADVCFDKTIVGFFLNIFEVSEVACVGEFIHIDNTVVRILVYE